MPAHSPAPPPYLIGEALGIYGLTQGLLQIPFGLLSDRIGRKIMIVAGLVLFGIGSAVAAISTSIDGVIVGRALQGAGPVVANFIGVSGIFWLMVGLAALGIAITEFVVPLAQRISVHRDAEAVPALLGAVLRNRELLRLDLGIFTLHATFTAIFLVVPDLLRTTLAVAL